MRNATWTSNAASVIISISVSDLLNLEFRIRVAIAAPRKKCLRERGLQPCSESGQEECKVFGEVFGILGRSICTYVQRSVKAMKIEPEQFEGLEWGSNGHSFGPQWTTDPDIERIREVVTRVLSLPPQQEVAITSFAEGSFNKLYTIRIDEKELIIRVALPVDPRWKTLSEAATVEWVRRNTDAPVPEIIAFDASRDNPIGFEWIIMSKLPGRPLTDVWGSIDFSAKKELTRRVAVLVSSIFKKQLRGIGNLSSIPEVEILDERDLPKVQRIVSTHFFWGDHILQPVPRGPFPSSRDWLEACLLLCEHDCTSAIARWGEWPDQGEVENPCGSLKVIRRLKSLLDDLFPSSTSECAEPSILFHGDLAQHNILVDEAGVLTGVVDWECVSALPLWKACNYPKFLQDLNEDAKWEALGRGYDRNFWSDMVHHDATFLRKYFLEEMQRLEPGWVEIFEASERQREFAAAVENCTLYYMLHHINAWIDDIAQGKEIMRSLSHRAYDGGALLEC